MTDASTFLTWHTGVQERIYLGTLDITVPGALEVSVHGPLYAPEVTHTLQSDLADELAGTRQALTNIVYSDTSAESTIEGVVHLDSSTWAPYVGLARTLVWSLVATGEVVAHAGAIDSSTGLTDVSGTAGGRVEWGPIAITPTEPPVGGRGASTVVTSLGWSPARGYTSTSVPAGLTAFGTFIGTTPRALVTFAHNGQGGSYASQQQAINAVTNPSLATWQVKGIDCIHVIKIVLIRKGASETLAMLARGDFDAHWRAVGKILHDNGFDVAKSDGRRNVICPGWEINGDWYAWYPKLEGNSVADFASGRRRAMLCMMAGTTGSIDFTAGTVAAGTASSGVLGQAANGIDRNGVDVELNVNTKGKLTRAEVKSCLNPFDTAIGSDDYDLEKVNAPAAPADDGKPVYSGHPTEKAKYWARNWTLGQEGQADTTKDTLVGLEWLLQTAQELDLYYTVSEFGVLTGTAKVGDDNTQFFPAMAAHIAKAVATGRVIYTSLSDYTDSAGQGGQIRSDARLTGALATFKTNFTIAGGAT